MKNNLSLVTLFKSSSLVFVSTLIKNVCGLLLSVLLFRYLGENEYGYYVTVYAIFTVIIGMFSFRTKEAISKFVTNFDIDYMISRCASIDFVMCAITSFISAVFVSAYTIFFQKEAGAEINFLFLIFISASFFLKFIEPTFFSVCRVKDKYYILALVEMVVAFSVIIPILILLYFGVDFSLELVSFIILFQSISRLIIEVILINIMNKGKVFVRPYSLILDLFIKKDEISKFLKMDYLNTFISIPIKQGDIIILSFFANTEKIAMYKIAKNILNIILQITNSVSIVIFQKFIELSKEHTKVFIIKFLSIWIPLIALGTLVLFYLNEKVIILTYGEGALASSLLLNVMLPFFFVSLSLFWVWPLILKEGLLKETVFQTILSGLIFFLLGPLASYFYGELGMAVVNAFVFSFSGLCGLYILINSGFFRNSL